MIQALFIIKERMKVVEDSLGLVNLDLLGSNHNYFEMTPGIAAISLAFRYLSDYIGISAGHFRTVYSWFRVGLYYYIYVTFQREFIFECIPIAMISEISWIFWEQSSSAVTSAQTVW